MELSSLPGPIRRPRVWQASTPRSPGAGTVFRSRRDEGVALTTCRAGPDDPRDDDTGDIDELARRLSREAAERGMGQNQYGDGRPTTWQNVLDTFDGSRLGEFFPEEFELLQEQGRLGSEGGDPVLIAYASRYYSGMPFEDPVLASLREFVPNEQDPMLGVRELIVLSHLCGGFPRARPGGRLHRPTPTLPAIPRSCGFWAILWRARRCRVPQRTPSGSSNSGMATRPSKDTRSLSRRADLAWADCLAPNSEH